MASPLEIKINRETLSWWLEITAMENEIKMTLSRSAYITHVGILVGFMAIVFLTVGVGFAGFFVTLVGHLFIKQFRGDINRRNEYIIWSSFTVPKRHMLSAFFCSNPEEPDKSYMELPKIVAEGISTGPWDPGKHRFRITNNLGELVLTKYHEESFQL